MELRRRSTKDIFEMKNKIQNNYLKADREDKDTFLLKAKLTTLEWVLGNDTSL